MRKPIRVGGRWFLEEGIGVEVACRDISLGGCFVEAESPPQIDTAVVLEIDLPGLRDAAGQPVAAVIQARVRWTTDEGMGIQFGLMGARETAALVELLRPSESDETGLRLARTA